MQPRPLLSHKEPLQSLPAYLELAAGLSSGPLQTEVSIPEPGYLPATALGPRLNSAPAGQTMIADQQTRNVRTTKSPLPSKYFYAGLIDSWDLQKE